MQTEGDPDPLVRRALAHHHPVRQRIYFGDLHNSFRGEFQRLIWLSKTVFPKDPARIDIVVCIISQMTSFSLFTSL